MVNPDHAKVKERYKGNSDKVVIHVQDAHNSYEAQENISNLIGELNQKGVISSVGVEGAEGPVDVTPYASYPIKSARDLAAKQLVKTGRASGAEHQAILSDGELSLFGVENGTQYSENFEAFQKVINTAEVFQESLASIQVDLQEQSEELVNNALKELLEQGNVFREKETEFLTYYQTVLTVSQKIGLETIPFIHFHHFIEVFSIANQIDYEVLPQEEQELIETIQALPEKEQQELGYFVELSGVEAKERKGVLQLPSSCYS